VCCAVRPIIEALNAVTGDSHISLLIGVGQVWLGSSYLAVVQGTSPRETPEVTDIDEEEQGRRRKSGGPGG